MALHAHSYGRRIGAFIKNPNNGKWDRIYENQGQLDFLKHDIEPPLRIEDKFELVVRCIYDTTSSKHAVKFGTKVENEMCTVNFFYYSNDTNVNLKHCLSGLPTNLHPEIYSANPLPDPIEFTKSTHNQLSDQVETFGEIPMPEETAVSSIQQYNMVAYVCLTSSLVIGFIIIKLKIKK